MRIGPFLNLVTPDVAHMRRSMVAHKIIIDALRSRDGMLARRGIEQDIRDAAADMSERLQAQAAVSA
jgi:DNA-binding GntR family transcriptional regulator